jgi:hypothetical protein
MGRKTQQSAKPARVREVSVGIGGARERDADEPSLTPAQVRYLRRRASIEVGDPERYTFVKPKTVVVVELGDDWIAEVELTAQEDGIPVIARVEIGPRQFDPEQAAPLPRGGLSKRTLESLPVEAVLAEARAALRTELGRADDAGDEVMRWQGFEPDALDQPRSRGYSQPNRFYAQIAAAYCEAIECRCRAPRREVAEQLNRTYGGGYSEAFVRDALRCARARGLLTPAVHGVARGRLTDRGKAALQRP